jgi:hypothetical protein
MTREELFEAYRNQFGVYPSLPARDFGLVDVTVEELTDLCAQALEDGEPIDWAKHLAPIPDDAKS